jgi:Lectin C-type domain
LRKFIAVFAVTIFSLKFLKETFMLPNNKNLLSSLLVSGLTLLGSASTVQADSLRVRWIGNGHFYQLFDTKPLTWFDAQTTCKSKGAHLATITSIAENSFIYANKSVLDSNNAYYYWIGATDAAKEGTHTWLNGEKLTYSHWVNTQAGTNYNYSFYSYANIGFWLDGTANEVHAYLCEWSAHNFIDVAYVPDLNNNRISETAALYVDFVTGKHTVKIKDSQTQKVLNTLTFLTSLTPPQGLVSLVDINGNRVPEIAVLYDQLNQPSVGIKDAKNNGALLKTIRFLGTGYEPKAITVTPDANGNGSNEITVLGISKANGTAASETRDSKTGALLKKTAF